MVYLLSEGLTQDNKARVATCNIYTETGFQLNWSMIIIAHTRNSYLHVLAVVLQYESSEVDMSPPSKHFGLAPSRAEAVFLSRKIARLCVIGIGCESWTQEMRMAGHTGTGENYQGCEVTHLTKSNVRRRLRISYY